MAKNTEHPIIMPLSNPTSKSEAVPEDLIKWTDGKVFTATGSPFVPVKYKGKEIRISQGNNAFVYPGLGLGVVAAKAKRVTDKMILAASNALGECSPSLKDKSAPLLPDWDEVRAVGLKVAKAVLKQAITDGVAQVDKDADFDALIREHTWKPQYYP